VWVDLKVVGPTEISQEHVRIRRDPATGEFFIKDLSRNGTTVNGERIPGGVAYDGDMKREIEGNEVRLPARAEIALADSARLTFTRAQP
jgi:pSer/pThr/pTyr-binding forkhead associated (FHA) protein